LPINLAALGAVQISKGTEKIAFYLSVFSIMSAERNRNVANRKLRFLYVGLLYYHYYRLTDSKNLKTYKENLQPFATLDFFQDVEYHYDNILEKLNLQTLHIRRRHFDALFLINAFSGTKYCSSVLETVGIRVPTRSIRNFTAFSCSFSHCPSAKCVSAHNAVCKSIDIFSNYCLNVKSLN
jgi:hypothetical protein